MYRVDESLFMSLCEVFFPSLFCVLLISNRRQEHERMVARCLHFHSPRLRYRFWQHIICQTRLWFISESTFYFDRGTNNKNKQFFPTLQEGRRCRSIRSSCTQQHVSWLMYLSEKTRAISRFWSVHNGVRFSFIYNRSEGQIVIISRNDSWPRVHYLIVESKHQPYKPWSRLISWDASLLLYEWYAHDKGRDRIVIFTIHCLWIMNRERKALQRSTMQRESLLFFSLVII